MYIYVRVETCPLAGQSRSAYSIVSFGYAAMQDLTVC